MRLGVSLSVVAMRSMFGPIQLFAANEPGAWYDPSDLTTLFQDTAGTTPVTAPAQTVARINDKSGRGNHATQATTASRPTYGIVPSVGRRNLLTYTEQFDNAAWKKQAFGVASVPVFVSSTITAPDGSSTAWAYTFNTNAGTTSGDSSRLVNDTPLNGSQLLLRTGQIYAKVASGTANIEFGIPGSVASVVTQTLTTSWQLVTFTGTNTVTVSGVDVTARGNKAPGLTEIHLWHPQLELGSTATAYQKVVTQFEVTEAGVPSLSYLSFDGVDDFLITPTITPGIDKAQAFAGVRKLSDAASFPVIVESSATINTNNGAILLSGRGAGVAGFNFGSKGTTAANSTGVSSAAPVTCVLSGLGDISAPSSRMRVNGVAGTAVVTSQGTGNYLAYPLYIGRRGGTSSPFSGQIYSLIVRFGATLTADQIAATETWVNSKTGAY